MENIVIALLQRVKSASVEIDGSVTANIDEGLLVFIAFTKQDGYEQSPRLAERILNYRIFSDNKGLMNMSVIDKNFDILVVPQFTLAANTNSGNRPSFSGAAKPEVGQELFNQFIEQLNHTNTNIKTGVFGAMMQIQLVNDGPATFWLEVK